MMSAPQYRKRDVARAFGLVLHAAREERGISQQELAEICDFDRSYASLLERGVCGPTLVMVLQLAGALGIEPERLVVDTVNQLNREAQS